MKIILVDIIILLCVDMLMNTINAFKFCIIGFDHNPENGDIVLDVKRPLGKIIITKSPYDKSYFQTTSKTEFQS